MWMHKDMEHTSFLIIKAKIDIDDVQSEGKKVHKLLVPSILSIVDRMYRGLRFVHLVKWDDQLVEYKICAYFENCWIQQ